MEKILDIYGYSADYDSMYEAMNSWFGRIIVTSNLSFEGIVNDFDQQNTYFVFGTIEKDQISLMKCAKGDDHVPYLFRASNEDGKYYGDYMTKSPYFECPLGECKISLLPDESISEDTNLENALLKLKIKKIKEQLGELGEELYTFYKKSKTTEEITKK